MQIFTSSAIDNADAVKALLSNGFAFFYRLWFIVFMFAWHKYYSTLVKTCYEQHISWGSGISA